jgi:hypothetical protein
MANRKKNCPFCGVAIAPEAIRAWRPFSCPQCTGIVATRSVYHKLGSFGCVGSVLLSATVGWIITHHWIGVVAGSFAGIVTGVLVANLVLRVLTRLRPSAPLLEPRIIRDEPTLFPQIADLLESLAVTETWGDSSESRLSILREQTSLDDSLIVAAIDAAEQYENLLVGKPPHRVKTPLQQLRLDELRVELRAIARDLRIAAK